ncbi:MAG: hypothetical protein V1768_00655 [Patescibacteria group bacterium]|nr:hypothetical protein [Patescibacteria group bacterium]MBU1160294.1 hypothetical protein [Patescibacteria group bacterium]MBU1350178.1 hypothetical protein [Patescibacteria group bacterium]MBU1421500.1 hypothetical protein [Patescibacteria group bacterium]MBU1684054.1 hypothetical protein [Patescibacteria group bacterium]
MTLKTYLLVMIATTIICWSVFVFIVLTINPEITNWIGFLLFYLSLFLSASGSVAIIGFIIRFIALKHELIFYSVKTAFRQSFLISFLIIVILFLLSHNLFTWTNLFLLIFGLSILEFFLTTYCYKKI